MSHFSDSDAHLDRLPTSPKARRRPDLSGKRNSSLRSSVRAVTAAHRFTTVSSHNDNDSPSTTPDVEPANDLRKVSSRRSETTYHWLSGAGNEPGVDVSRQADEKHYGKLLQDKVRVTVVDYWNDPEAVDTDGSRVEVPGDKFNDWLDSKDGRRPGEDQDGNLTGKSVRWINVDGLNWDVVKTLTLKYGLHPLAVEDVLRANRSPRSKLDFYRNHLYLQILVQHMHKDDGPKLDAVVQSATEGTSSRPEGYGSGRRPLWRKILGLPPKNNHLLRLPEGVEGVFEPSVDGGPDGHASRPPLANDAHRMVVDHLSAKYMVPIRRGIMSCFMNREGVIVTIAQYPCASVLAPIYERLEDGESLLRRSADASMLLQALLDVVVDISLDITRQFESEIVKMEAGCLVDPQMETVRHLHVLSSQLIRLRRTLTPLLHVLYNLRDQDVQRSQAAAALNADSAPRQEHSPGVSHHDSARNLEPTSASKPHIPFNGISHDGYISSITKVYLGDVIDHLEVVLSSVDQFVATADHLTDYVFNMLSFVTNASMERLSIVTVVFLPLTFIASYFGMNFTQFSEIEGPVSYFWKVAAPLTLAFFFIFSFGYLRRGAQTIERRIGRWRRQKMVEERTGVRRKAQ